ncbi:MAG: COG1615 family transporter [Synechococcales cyanobacterium CRU_2_2]|nr:COG1615 family transporter [Synechococcales cyanobacterium CRU_2_2]
MVQRKFANTPSSWLLGAIALFFGLDFAAWLIAENLWFAELGYSQVFWLRMQVRLGLWALITLLSGSLVIWNFRRAWHLRNQDPPEAIPRSASTRVLRHWLQPETPRPVPDRLVSLGLRMLLLTLGALGLLLALLIYHYGREVGQVWSIGTQMLQRAPELPRQFTLQTLLQDVLMLSAQPWQWLLLGGLTLFILVFPWPTLISLGTLLVLGFGFWASTHWSHLLPLLNATAFGLKDPQFDRDISFYLFALPIWELLRFWLVGLLLFMLVTVTILYLGGTGSMNRGLFRGFSLDQQHHLYGLGGQLMLLVALSHWLSRYERLYVQRGSTFSGASYADVKVLIPVDTTLTAIAILIALALLARAIDWPPRRAQGPYSRISPPGSRRFNPLQFVILHPFLDLWLVYIITVAAVGNLLPDAIQNLVVLPNEFARELPYIERSIQATRAAFDLDNIEVQSFDPSSNLTRKDLQANQITLDNIRLWDTRPLLEANRQLQQIRLYYSFPTASLDRYDLTNDAAAGKQQVIISARELDYAAVPSAAKTWINRHLVYTHGYGFTLSPANIAGEGGLPTYFVKDIGENVTIQGNPELGITEQAVRQAVPLDAPRIYYGNLTNTYVMTNTQSRELDYPSGNGNVETVYDGQGGIPIGAPGRRFLFGLYLRDVRLWLTRTFKPSTKLLFRRNIQSRVRAIAPFLRFDADPYLVTSNQPLVDQQGRLVASPAGNRRELNQNLDQNLSQNPPKNYLYWIVDAYTTSDRYPYSAPGDRNFNYIRNSVKVIVDAYNGSAYFYISDPKDPIIQTWSRVFPNLFQPLGAMPQALRDHIRYPIDLFGIQSERLLIYHMTDPKAFYNREDQWQIPTEIYGNEPLPVEPYYLIMRLPTAEREEFVLLHPFTPVQRNNLTAWLAGRSDGDNYGKLLLYQFPKQRLSFGPEQIEARINQEPSISQLISLWDRQGSRVVQGNLLVIPVEESLLYVEPLYLEAERNSLPTLIRVIVAYGDQIVMADTLQAAIAQLFPRPSAQAAASPSLVDRPDSATQPLSPLPDLGRLEAKQQ